MNTTLILLTAIASSILIFLISQLTAWLRDRYVIVLAVAAFGLYAAFLILRPDNWMLINLLVLSVAGIGGSGLGLFLVSKPALISFCIAASIVDIYSVTQGITSDVVDNFRDGSSDLLSYLVISAPIGENIQPIVGIGDFFIISAVYFALARLGYNRSQLLLAPLTGLLLAIAVGLLVGGVFAIPFISATTILYMYWQDPHTTNGQP
jgi:hypothetical protein